MKQVYILQKYNVALGWYFSKGQRRNVSHKKKHGKMYLVRQIDRFQKEATFQMDQ